MTYRLIMSNAGLVISKPGVDVTTNTSILNSIFDSRKVAYVGLFASGVVSTSSFSSKSSSSLITPGNASVDHVLYTSIAYGKTFGSPPFARLMWEMSGVTGAAPSYNNDGIYFTNVSGIEVPQGGETLVAYCSYADHLYIEVVFLKFSSTVSGPSSVAYFIGQH
jgi:hypothetical protein